MKKETKISPRVKYEEVAYYVTSYKAKTDKKDYYISRITNDILRKLIHIESQNKAINYSNRVISIFTDISIRQVEDAISDLKHAGYINCYYHYVTVNTNREKRRTIFINWDFIEKIFDMIPPKVFNLYEDNAQDAIESKEQPAIQPELEAQELQPQIKEPVSAPINSEKVIPIDQPASIEINETEPIALNDIKTVVRGIAENRGINPYHKDCGILVSRFQTLIRTGEAILMQHINDAFDAEFPNKRAELKIF